MQCFICVIYLMIMCNAHPPKERDDPNSYQGRSLFHDVIESIGIRSRISENQNQNIDNSLEQNNQNYEFEIEFLHLPHDSSFTHRRNDRIEMPPLKYRFPKSLKINDTHDGETPKEEPVVDVNYTPGVTTEVKTETSQNPKKQTRSKPNSNKMTNRNAANDTVTDRPVSNTMMGKSQIGNRDSQIVIKPTVIVNFRGSVNNKESEVRIEARKNENETNDLPQNNFIINQKIEVEKVGGMVSGGDTTQSDIKQNVGNVPIKPDQSLQDMFIFGMKDENIRIRRKYDSLQILFSV